MQPGVSSVLVNERGCLRIGMAINDNNAPDFGPRWVGILEAPGSGDSERVEEADKLWVVRQRPISGLSAIRGIHHAAIRSDSGG